MKETTLIGMRPVGMRVMVFIYDDGNDSVDLGNGKRLITGVRDTDFDSPHNAIDGKHPGIRPRWAIVTGTNDQTPDYIKLGAKVYLDEMKWRRGVMASPNGERVWDIRWEDILLVDEDGVSGDEVGLAKVLDYLEAFGSELPTS